MPSKNPHRTSAPPTNWPPALPYLSTPHLSPRLHPAALTALRTAPPTPTIPTIRPTGPSTLVKIQPITTPAHPAHTQSGLFAARALPPDSFILLYTGIVHSSSSSSTTATPNDDPHASSDYDLSLDRAAHGLSIDAARAGNEARFVNDYRGVAARPNAEFREVWLLSVPPMRAMSVWVLPRSSREAKVTKGARGARVSGIAKGEEILVSYGRGFWGARRAPGGEEELGGMEDAVVDEIREAKGGLGGNGEN